MLGPQKIGIAANNIPHLKKKQAGQRFSSLQKAQDARRRGPGKQFKNGRP